MKRVIRVTATALAAWTCVVAWLLAAVAIAGVWLDCLPGDAEYPGLTTTAAWERSIVVLVAVVALTAVIWVGTRRLASRQ